MRGTLLKASAVLALAVLTFSSCTKCQDCVCGINTIEICSKEFDSKEEYNNTIAARKSQGCTCTAK